MARSFDRAILFFGLTIRDLGLRQVVAVVVHDFVPGGGEGLDEVGGGVGGGVAFGDAAELGVGAEDEVDAGAGPF